MTPFSPVKASLVFEVEGEGEMTLEYIVSFASYDPPPYWSSVHPQKALMPEWHCEGIKLLLPLPYSLPPGRCAQKNLITKGSSCQPLCVCWRVRRMQAGGGVVRGRERGRKVRGL